MKLNKLFAIFAVAFLAVSCIEQEFALVQPDSLYTDASFKEQFPEAEQISIAELKYAYGTISGKGENAAWSNTVFKVIGEEKYSHIYDVKTPIIFEGKDLYIKGKVISDDTEGNVYKTLYIQDETSGIEIKLNNNVGLKYRKGTWVYVRLTGLYLGNYRMMLSLEGPPSESYNKAGEHKFYANSNLELQSIIDQHVFAGTSAGELKVGNFVQWQDAPESVDIITVTPDNYLQVFSPSNVTLEGKFTKSFQMKQRELMYGRLIRFEGLECRYAGVPAPEFDENGNIIGTYTNPGLKSGDFENIYPSWLYSDPRPTVSKGWYRWAFKEEITGRSLYGSVCFTYDPNATLCSAHGLYTLRTSGYSRFARQPICKDGEKATITAIYGIYAKNTSYTADANDYASYQLTISSIKDIEFENGQDALLTEEQVEFLTTQDMKTVPWIDEEVGDDAY